METDYKAKIRKLLALAESPYEGEAKAALLKARQLMAEHKLTEAELGDAASKSVKNILTDITCSKRREPWIIDLSAVIGENYCCQSYRSRFEREQTNRVGFIGFEDDVELCVEIFQYAVDCVRVEIKRRKKEYAGLPDRLRKQLADSYGYGFAAGVSDAFEAQQAENEQKWGLVMVMPQEVIDASQHLGHEDFSAQAQDSILRSSFTDGRADGQAFDPARRLKSAAEI